MDQDTLAIDHGRREGVGSFEPDRGPVGLKRATDVLLALSVAELRARYGRGSIRFVKWIFDPFAAVGVYLLLVALILDLPGEAPGLSIACAVIAFQIVLMTIASSMDSIRSRGSIILNMGFRKGLIPIAVTMTESLAFASSLALLAIMMAVYGIAPTVAILWFPAVLGINILFAAACAFPMTLVGLWYEDMRPFVVSLVRTMFFLAPGLVPLSQISGGVSDLIWLNPLTGMFEAYRDVLLYGQAPAAWELLYPLGIAIAMLVAFVPLFLREQRHFAKLI